MFADCEDGEDLHPLFGVILSQSDASRALAEIEQAACTQVSPTESMPEAPAGECRFAELTGRFGLSAIEQVALLASLAPEIDRRYEKVYGFLQDDVTQRHPTVNLAARLALGDCLQASIEARRVFAEAGKLRRYNLIELFDSSDNGLASLLGSGYRVTNETAGFLLNTAAPREHSVVTPCESLAPLVGRAASLVDNAKCTLFLIDCDQPVQAHRFAGMVAGQLQCELGEPGEMLQAALRGHTLCVSDPAAIEDWELWFELAGASAPAAFIWGGLPVQSPPGWRVVRPEIPAAEKFPRYNLSPDQMEVARQTAAAKALWEQRPASPADEDDVSREISAHRLQELRLGRYAVPLVDLNRLVLPPATMPEIDELCTMVRTRQQLLRDSGFARLAGRARGVSALFHGPPGTGKTFAAEAIGAQLNLDIYRVDLSQIINKYIGETEKQFAKLFDIAEHCGVVLFFDEADALFGKRTGVKDANDRFANVAVAYLLQRLEEYSGVSILATNLRDNLDNAFTRRFAAIIEFPFPGERERCALWRTLLPQAIDDGVCPELLAREIILTGGAIRNIILLASALAADAGQQIGMNHLNQATAREYAKHNLKWAVLSSIK